MVIRGRGTTQSGTLGAVILDARTGTLAETAGRWAQAGTCSATSVVIGTSRLRPGQLPYGRWPLEITHWDTGEPSCPAASAYH
jgi:hypothetical protein